MHSKQRALDALARHLGLYGPGIRTIAKPLSRRQTANIAMNSSRLRRIAKGTAIPERATSAAAPPAVSPVEPCADGPGEKPVTIDS
jgi:hypothetical protein